MPVSLPSAFEKRHSVLKNFHIFFSNFKRNIWLVINPPWCLSFNSGKVVIWYITKFFLIFWKLKHVQICKFAIVLIPNFGLFMNRLTTWWLDELVFSLFLVKSNVVEVEEESLEVDGDSTLFRFVFEKLVASELMSLLWR